MMRVDLSRTARNSTSKIELLISRQGLDVCRLGSMLPRPATCMIDPPTTEYHCLHDRTGQARPGQQKRSSLFISNILINKVPSLLPIPNTMTQGRGSAFYNIRTYTRVLSDNKQTSSLTVRPVPVPVPVMFWRPVTITYVQAPPRFFQNLIPSLPTPYLDVYSYGRSTAQTTILF